MKKIVIAVVAVCAAVVANAATVKWTASNISPSGSSTSYYAVLVDATGSTWTAADVAQSLIAGNFSGTTLWAGAGTYNDTKKIVAISSGTVTAPAGYDSNQELSYIGLLFDASSASAAQNYIAITGDSPVAGQFSAQGLLSVASGSQSGKAWTAAVPEPTTGLLMLLGIAGLALRRRRA